MATNKVALRSVEEFMQDYKPVYIPFWSLFLKKSQKYPTEVGERMFRRANTVGDIRAKHITPKDTEIKQIGVNTGTKKLKAYFLGNQFIVSLLQNQEGNEDVIAQVLDEHNKQFDELMLLGEGTSASTMVNNGLFWSNDPNYNLQNSIAIAAGTATDHLKDLHTQIMVGASVANDLDGEKVLMLYGALVCASYDSLYANSDAPFKSVLGEVLGAGWTVIKMPTAVTPSSANGWIIVNLDQIKVHYTEVPSLESQGVNDEKKYSWHNFLMGSMMVEVLAANAIYRQPVTYA